MTPVLSEKLFDTCEFVSKRGTLAIVGVLLSGPQRQSEILHQIQHLNSRTLAKRLQELEDTGIVQRSVFPEMPVRIEYELTPKGRDMGELISDLENWTKTWQTSTRLAKTV